MERSSEEKISSTESLNLKETELRLGLPGSDSPKRTNGVSIFGKKNLVSGSKRAFSDANVGKWVFSPSEVVLEETVPALPQSSKPLQDKDHATAAKAQVVGWPPIRSFRKNTMATNSTKSGDDSETKTRPECLYVKVSMDGAPYLRKVDLEIYSSYTQLSSALEKMFSCFTIGQCSSDGLPGRDGLSKSRLMDLLHGSEYVLTYEDKDHDWMLVGDVPWEMFTESCKRLRIMKGSEVIGLAPRAIEKCKIEN